MKTKLLPIYWLIGILLISACNEDEEAVYVESELQAYFDAFEAEAQARNVSIDWNEASVSAYLSDIENASVYGRCIRLSEQNPKIEINQTYWDSASEMEREYLLFHELGHCVLGRKHDDSKDGSGHCISIMQSGDDACKMRYRLSNRSALIDELFENR